MKLRTMAGAFLTCGDKVLLLHRGLHKELAPGMWSCVGGHLEQGELNNPMGACFREIEEETGIGKNSIIDLKLRYIVVRKTNEEIRTVYYFTGSVASECQLPDCNEGTLHWVKLSDMPGLEMSYSVKEITNHWLCNQDSNDIILCGMNKDNNEITWHEL